MNPGYNPLKESAIQILACDGDFYQMIQSVGCMYSIYRSISDINANDQNDVENSHKVVQIPEEVGECKQLKFYTTIKVFGNHWLPEGDCSLNIPLKVCELDEDERKTIIFWYEQGEIPGIHFQFAGSSSQYAAIGKTYC